MCNQWSRDMLINKPGLKEVYEYGIDIEVLAGNVKRPVEERP